jgi:hypothetical protein
MITVVPGLLSEHSFTVHDFFTEQPVKGADVYFLRDVLHNWTDEEAIRILSLTRAAATSSSRLVIFDPIVTPTCHDPTRSSEEHHPPLLGNMGIAGSGFTTILDVLVC